MLGDTLESGDALVAMFALESLIVASVPLLLAPLGTLGTMLGVLGSFLGSPGTQKRENREHERAGGNREGSARATGRVATLATVALET